MSESDHDKKSPFSYQEKGEKQAKTTHFSSTKIGHIQFKFYIHGSHLR